MSTTTTTSSTTPVSATGINVGTGTGAQTAAPSTSTTATAAPAPQPPQQQSAMNFRQLDELSKKYMNQMRDQEKEFLDLATKVNYWDRALESNSDKILKMSDSMKTVKRDHERMSSLIETIKVYQKDYETLIEYLEAHVPEPTTPTIKERAEFYAAVETVQGNLQQLTENLKEIVRLANASNKLTDRNDPVSQIIRILNEHTDTLQWIDAATDGIQEGIDSVSKMHQILRRDHERSLRLMFKPN